MEKLEHNYSFFMFSLRLLTCDTIVQFIDCFQYGFCIVIFYLAVKRIEKCSLIYPYIPIIYCPLDMQIRCIFSILDRIRFIAKINDKSEVI